MIMTKTTRIANEHKNILTTGVIARDQENNIKLRLLHLQNNISNYHHIS